MTQEKVALVTGVSSGIGQATAGLLAERGFRVFGTTRSLGQANKRLGNVELVQLDVRDAESVSSCLRTVLDKAGRIDALVNNAGYTLIGSLGNAARQNQLGAAPSCSIKAPVAF